MSADLEAPLFLGGVAGSGKTRLGSLLGRHPSLSVTRKTYLWRDHYGRYGDLDDRANHERCSAAVLASPGVDRLGLDPDRLRAELARRPVDYNELFARVHRLRAESVNKPRWCDQLGLVELFADAIFAGLPGAKMIHMISDPRRPPTTARRPGTVGWDVGKWLTSVRLADRNADRYGDRYLVLRHEDFEADEEATLRRVCAFLDEPVDPNVIAATRPDRRPGLPTREPRAVRFIERCAGDLMARHGYPPAGEPTPGSMRGRLVHDPADFLALTAWRRVRVPAITRRLRAAA